MGKGQVVRPKAVRNPKTWSPYDEAQRLLRKAGVKGPIPTSVLRWAAVVAQARRAQSSTLKQKRLNVEIVTELLRNPDLVAAMDSLYRLTGTRAASVFLGRIGKAAVLANTHPLAPEERAQRMADGRRTAMERRARSAARSLELVRANVRDLERSLKRAKKGLKFYADKVKKYQKKGLLPQETT